MKDKSYYTKPKLIIHGDIKEITKGRYEGDLDADGGDITPPPSL